MKRHTQCPISKEKKHTSPNLAFVEPLPVTSRASKPDERIVAIFTGLTVEVCDPAGIEKLALGGCFGQGTLSRSFPKAIREGGYENSGELPVVRRRVLKRREDWHRKYGTKGDSSAARVRVLEEEVEKQLQSGAISQRQLKYAVVETKVNPFSVPEHLSLMFEESLFLVRELKCLEVRTFEGVVLSEEDLLKRFSKLNSNFLELYVAYHYMKSKNWIIKSGLKFGGDFILYQKGPQFFHASYIVLVQPYRNGERLPQCSSHYLDNFDFQGFNRIAETTAKDLLILEVHFPCDLDPSDFVGGLDRLNEFKVSEMFPKHHNLAANRISHQASTSSWEHSI